MGKLPWTQLSLVVLVLGFLIGGVRSWHNSKHTEPLAGSGADITQIELLTTEDKASWVRTQVYLFNEKYYDKYHVTVHYVDSRSAMQSIIQGTEKPVLWSPESPIWVARLADYWREHHDTSIVDVDDPEATHIYLRSPLVVLTTQKKIKFLREHLNNSHFYQSLIELNKKPDEVPWGRLSYAYAYPTVSHSGMAVLGTSINEYTRESISGQPIQVTAKSSGYAEYLKLLNRGYVNLPSCKIGTNALTNEFAKNTSVCDFIFTYESLAVRLAMRNKNLAVIYLTPTESAEVVVSVIGEKWVTSKQREVAKQFLAYLDRPQTIKEGLRYNLRPASSITSQELDRRLVSLSSLGFQQTYISEDVPPYDALNSAAAVWNATEKHK